MERKVYTFIRKYRKLTEIKHKKTGATEVFQKQTKTKIVFEVNGRVKLVPMLKNSQLIQPL